MTFPKISGIIKYRKAVGNSKNIRKKGQFMDEKNVASQSKNSEPVEVSKWAKRAIWCIVSGYLVFLVWLIVMIGTESSSQFKNMVGMDSLTQAMCSICIVLPGTSIAVLVGLIFGIIALRKIAIDGGKLRGKWRAVTAIILSLLFFFIIAGGIILISATAK